MYNGTSGSRGLPMTLPFDPKFNTYPPYVLTTRLTFASYALVIYDYFCTFDSEVELGWGCPWSTGLFLFYLNRYLPFIDIALFFRPFASSTISQQECLWLFPLTTWIFTFGMIVPQFIVVLRTYAIWGLRPAIFYILALQSTLTFSSMALVTAWKTFLDHNRLHTLITAGYPLPDNIRCQISAMDSGKTGRSLSLIFFLIVSVSEVVVLALTFVKAKQHLTQTSHKWVNQLYNNGIIYCTCIVGLSLANCVMTFSATPAYQPLLLPLHRDLHSVLCNRVVFLILKHRKSRSIIEPNDRRDQNTRVTGTVALFTSVYMDVDNPDIVCSSANVPTRLGWRERAQQEWIHSSQSLQ
ncbi:hypothetical protein CPC08DRAFT_752925 [Agrocybe pediades]|nr:hypothetical protein CPC08DRAFT_752925 [Agrocybe pediades]